MPVLCSAKLHKVEICGVAAAVQFLENFQEEVRLASASSLHRLPGALELDMQAFLIAFLLSSYTKPKRICCSIDVD